MASDWAAVVAPDEHLTRRPNAHTAFGHGIHHCLGAPLARLEGRIALTTLLERFPHIELAIEPARLTYRPSFIFHGLTDLPVRLGPPRAASEAAAIAQGALPT